MDFKDFLAKYASVKWEDVKEDPLAKILVNMKETDELKYVHTRRGTFLTIVPKPK